MSDKRAKTFLDTNISKSKTFVLYGNLKDTIWCPDLMPRDIEHYLVKLLKSKGYEHIIFFGEAGTKGAYCLDEQSARFFFSSNMDIPLPKALSDDFEQKLADSPYRETVSSDYEDNDSVTGSQVSDALESLFEDWSEDDGDDYRPGDLSSSASAGRMERAPAAPETEHTISIRRVRYAYRGQTMSEFLQKIHPLMLKKDSHMAVIFYNILTTDIKSYDLRDDILDIWEKNSRGNICLLLFPETLYNESALENKIRLFGLESKFLRPKQDPNQSSLNPINCFKICQPGIDEIKYMLRYLALVGNENGKKIKFKYFVLDDLAEYIEFISKTNALILNQGFEFMSEIYKRFSDFIDHECDSNRSWDGSFTMDTIDRIYEVFGLKNKVQPQRKRKEKSGADWAIERISTEFPEPEPEKTTDELLKELDDLVGLQTVKCKVREIIDLQNYNHICREKGIPVIDQSLHMVFTGNPGTGKTAVARLVGKIYRSIGVLSQGQSIEVGREDLVAPYVGQTALKTREVLDRAKGGVLFIDEAYTLATQSGNDFGQEAIDALLRYMENNRDDIVVIVAGYPDEMDSFIKSNPGLSSRFTQFIEFNDYSVDELMDIMLAMAKKSGHIMAADAFECAKGVIRQGREQGGRDFGNGRYVRNIYEAAIRSIASRVSGSQCFDRTEMMTFVPEDFKISNNSGETEIRKEKSTEQLLEELDQYIGLKQVKIQIRKLINQVNMNRERAARGIPVTKISLHMVFTGNPGTGKTSVARMIGELYKSIGVLSSGQLIEVGREDLVGQYIGHTAQKTKDVLSSAMGGILFIDEAYALSNSTTNDFGQEAIDTILRHMENNRDKLIVIVAGYPDEMERFIQSNPGLKSRFTTTIDFEDYSIGQLMAILELQCKKNGYVLTEDARDKAQEMLQYEKIMSGNNFGNGRVVRNIFEAATLNQNDRISSIDDLTDEEMMTLRAEDFG